MKIYTKAGDEGETKLLYGATVPKDSLAPEAYGSVDELVASIGLIRAEKELPIEIIKFLILELWTLLLSYIYSIHNFPLI